MVKCEKCGREFKNDLAVKIHIGKQHRRKAKGAAKAGKKAGGAFRCSLCGRSFAMAAHLARHRGASHGGAKKGKSGRMARREVVAGVDVRSLGIDELLGLRSQIEEYLADILRLIRKAR